MINVYDVNVEKTTTDTHRIYWSARRSPAYPTESVDDYSFQIFWSFDPITDFSPILNSQGNEFFIDGAIGPFYTIHTVKHTPHSREHYYKVRTISKTTPSNYKDSDTVYEGDMADGIIKTIVYAERVLNNNYIGESVYTLKRKTDGERCPQCWDPYQFRRTKTHCPTCRGTGFFDGFYVPIEGQVAFERNPKVVEVGQTGEMQVTTIKARMSHFPLLTPRDMIIAKESNSRFTVLRVDYTKLPNISYDRKKYANNAYIISQILTLAELTPDDDKYNVIIGGRDIRSYFNQSELKIPRNIIGNGNIVQPYKVISGS